MEERRPNVIQMSQEREETFARLVIPDLDFVIIASTDEQRLSLMEMNASHGSVVFVELVDQRLHAIVPQLNDSRMERSQDPRTFAVETQPLHPGRFRFELRQHIFKERKKEEKRIRGRGREEGTVRERVRKSENEDRRKTSRSDCAKDFFRRRNEWDNHHLKTHRSREGTEKGERENRRMRSASSRSIRRSAPSSGR